MGEKSMMGRVAINQSSVTSTTELSNIFIDEYLADANDAEIKVYLYLLRKMCAGEGTSVSDLADKFNYTEKDVERSLSYWEKQGLISLETNGSGHLTGIHMQDIVPKKSASITNLTAVAPLPRHNAPKKAEKKVVKHTDNPQMLFVAEQYFGRTLNTNEIKTIYYIQDELEFSEDLIDYLMQYCVSMDKKDFDYLRKVAMSWHEKGIKTPEEASLENKSKKTAYMIMKELGLTNAPTSVELGYFNKWQNEYNFTLQLIFEACKKTVLKVQSNRIGYCDSILESWYNKGVKTLEDVKRLDAEHSKIKNYNNSSDTVKVTNIFNSFKQNEYNFEDIEKNLLDN